MSIRGYNKVILVGNLSNDPTVKRTINGKPYAHFVVMINRKLRGREDLETSRIMCECWQESIYQHLAQGRRVQVEGSLKTWEEMQPDGTNRTRQIVSVDDVLFLDKPGGAEESRDESETRKELDIANGYLAELQARNGVLEKQMQELRESLKQPQPATKQRPIRNVRDVEVALKAAKKATRK